MSRPSVYYPASSLSSTGGSSGGGPASAAAAANLAAKQAELEGLRVLKEQSARLAGDVEKLGEQVDGLVQGGDGECLAVVHGCWT